MKIKKINFDFSVALVLPVFLSAVYANEKPASELSVEELLNVEVTTVSKKAQSLNDAAAAVFVITQDDIRRIGARSIPEALRLAPGVDVARINSHQWAVSIRGFNNRMSNKLLVLIDGRNLYTRAFSGTYWEQADVMMEDINRIEVIRGPGATLWGANAVNGVINIITKQADKTQGGLLAAGGGTEQTGFGALRYGGKINQSTAARAYIKGDVRDENSFKNDQDAGDSWQKMQTGFRLDSDYTSRDSVTVQGDAFYNWMRDNTMLPIIKNTRPQTLSLLDKSDSFGGNVLFRQKHIFSPTSSYQFQAYYDFYQIQDIQRQENRHAIDLDFQHRFSVLDRHDIVWGAHYRYRHDQFNFYPAFSHIRPDRRNDQLVSGFVQDEITLIENKLWLTLGSKFEHNDYSGFEFQPSVRALWAFHPKHRLWAAISRAVRTPSRAEHDLSLTAGITNAGGLPLVVRIEGNRGFGAEHVLSYEIGYRTTAIKHFSLDLTAFYNDYTRLRSARPLAPDLSNAPNYIVQPLVFVNEHRVHSYGLELATVWQPFSWWRWDAHYSWLKMEYSSREAMEEIGQSPQHRFFVRSALSPREDVDLDIIYRYVDRNIAIGVWRPVTIKDYMSLDIRTAWRIHKDLELSVVGQNLLQSHHQEYVNPAFIKPVEIDRGVYGKFTWRF